MTPEKVLYSDGHDVMVTDSFLVVKKSLYQLNGITNHGFLIIHPDRLPVFFLALIGGMMICLGAFHLVPSRVMGPMHFYSFELGINTLTLVVGTLMVVAGAIIMSFMKDKYALRIATAEGEKNVVVSPKKEYISQIVEALNKAFLLVMSPGQSKIRKMSEKTSKNSRNGN